MSGRSADAFRRFDEAELGICRYLNRSSEFGAIRRLFAIVSVLGDGWIWYALVGTLPMLYGRRGFELSMQMSVTGIVGIVLYGLIKNRAVRERPYITHSVIHCLAAPLDRYSFPSGHTMHAVCFTLLAAAHFPALGPVLAGFALLVALSRVVLGLHYPTDVAAGALLGGTLAIVSIEIAGLITG